MTKEERLASVGLPNTPAGVAQFYELFPDMESHDNYLANGGQPTANQFFNFGASTNLNIPFGNFAYGGGPCMECGGYMKDGGHWIQKATKNMRKDHPCTGSKFGGKDCPPGSRRYNLAKTFRAMAKKQYGGDTEEGASPDMDQDDFLENYKNTFMNKIKQNTMMSIADEAAAHADMMMAYGGYIPKAQDGRNIQVSRNPATGQLYTPEEWAALQASGQQAPLNPGATNDPYAGINLGKMTTWDYQGAPTPQFSTPESVGLQNKDPYTTMTPMDPANNGSRPAKTKGPGMNWNNFSGMAAAEGILGTVRGITSFANQLQYAQDANKRKDQTLADNAFVNSPINSQSRGDYDPNSGMFRINQHVPLRWNGYRFKQDGGETDLPIAKDGFNMKAGLYGTNGNRQFSLPMNTQAFSKAPISVRQTLEPVDREDANLEAEKGETAVLSVGGIPAHFNIGGKRHSQGGTPLSLPDDSFIFSDTKGMLIKDPIMLAQFGMVPTKAGYTPADIAKKFDINKFRKILANPDSEALEVKTAEMMIANYNMKLAKLALLQESMKGFPQGIPKIAMPYIEATGLDPAELIGGLNQTGVAQVDPNMIPVEQGQEDLPNMDMGVARYGGLMKAQNGVGLKYDYSKELSQIEKLQKDIEKEDIYKDTYAKLLGEWQNKHNNKKAYERTLWYKEEQAKGVDEQIKRKFDIIKKHSAETGRRDSKINSREWKYDHRDITQHKKDLVALLEVQQKLSQDWQNTNLLVNPPTYKSQEEYDQSLLQPYSNEKRIAQVSWLKEHPKTAKPKVVETKTAVKETLEDLGEVSPENIKALVSEGYHFIANGKTY